MKILKTTYFLIMSQYRPAPPEQGGILGMANGYVTEYIHDNAYVESESAVYIPDTAFLNNCIQKWALNDIEFCGLVHSHPSGQKTLSSSDLEYIKKLYKNNPRLEKTYYPLIVNGLYMFVYSAKKISDEIRIEEESLEIL